MILGTDLAAQPLHAKVLHYLTYVQSAFFRRYLRNFAVKTLVIDCTPLDFVQDGIHKRWAASKNEQEYHQIHDKKKNYTTVVILRQAFRIKPKKLKLF